jgi:hypothetical protein
MVIYKIFVFGADRKYKFSTGPPNDHSCKVTIQLA